MVTFTFEIFLLHAYSLGFHFSLRHWVKHYMKLEDMRTDTATVTIDHLFPWLQDRTSHLEKKCNRTRLYLHLCNKCLQGIMNTVSMKQRIIAKGSDCQRLC